MVLSPIVGSYIYLHSGQPISPDVWWIFAVLTYGIGDGFSTYLGVQMDDIEEGNPVGRYIFGAEPELKELMIFKAGALAFFFTGYLVMAGNPLRIFVPIGIAFVGLFATTTNLYFRLTG